MSIKFWVNDKTRMCSMTCGIDAETQCVSDGFREVTATEQDEFRKETASIKKAKRQSKGLDIKASADEIASVIKEFNK